MSDHFDWIAALETRDSEQPQPAGMMDRLFGSSEPKPAPVEPVPPMQQFPTSEDAEFAKKSGFGYGTRSEPYIQGKQARVLGRTPEVPVNYRVQKQTGPSPQLSAPGNFQPLSGAGSYLDELVGAVDDPARSKLLELDKAPPEVRDKVGDTFARTALAANRIPVAALGFDPSRMVMDTEMKDGTAGGAYGRSKDAIYFNRQEGRDPSSPVHEAIHRGIQKLRQDPEGAKLLKDLPSEEMITRYLMATQSGDPEKGSGSAGDKQREDAMKLFSENLRATTWKNALAKLTMRAQQLAAQERPMGPR